MMWAVAGVVVSLVIGFFSFFFAVVVYVPSSPYFSSIVFNHHER